MRRPVVVAVAVLVALFVASQLLVPPFAEHRVASRLTENGGHATVELSAFPAVRLLTGHGDRIRVRAQGIDLSLATPSGPSKPLLGSLDKFGSVDIHVSAARAGPFKLQNLAVERSGGGHDYTVTVNATATAADIATYAGGQIAGDLGGFAGSIASSLLPFSNEPVPLSVDAALRSDGGRPVVVSSSGVIDGIPINPLIEAVADALAGRI